MQESYDKAKGQRMKDSLMRFPEVGSAKLAGVELSLPRKTP